MLNLCLFLLDLVATAAAVASVLHRRRCRRRWQAQRQQLAELQRHMALPPLPPAAWRWERPLPPRLRYGRHVLRRLSPRRGGYARRYRS